MTRFAEKIHAESERMQTLVGDIIELNALDSEKVHQHEEQVSMMPLVQSCIEQLSPHFAAKHLSVYVTGDGFEVPGNQRQLWELVYNLLDNARRYNVEGGMIRVTVSDHTLTVQDTGIGIAKEHRAGSLNAFTGWTKATPGPPAAPDWGSPSSSMWRSSTVPLWSWTAPNTSAPPSASASLSKFYLNFTYICRKFYNELIAFFRPFLTFERRWRLVK